jgi:hypothetical protein
MKTRFNPIREPKTSQRVPRQPTKKDQILSLYSAGMTEVEDLAVITQSRPSYVASVLQKDHLLPGYFDLYTSTGNRMNVYSKFFARKVGFKDEEAARHSVELIDHFFRQFELAKDRPGQHHALMMALVMFDRARWTGKNREAAIFRDWLTARLNEAQGSSGPAADRN